MLWVLACAVLGLTALDHWTTYLCLREPVEGFLVSEANPLAAWLFDAIGLVPGLLLDSAVTVAAVLLVQSTARVPAVAKAFLFLVVGASTLGAVANNLRALEVLGLLLARAS